MPTITVRNLDPAVVEKLKVRARANNRSLQGELKELLERYAEERLAPVFNKQVLAESAARIREDIRRYRPEGQESDSVDLLRGDRDD